MFGSAALGALAPVVATITFLTVPSLISLAWTNILCAVFMLVLVVARGKWHELFNRKLWIYVFFVALCIGVAFYGLFYIGLSKTTPGNASIISLAEVLTVFIFFNLFKKESFSKGYMLGAALMILGACIVLLPGHSGVHEGDLIVLLSICFTPLGNHFQRKARAIASSESVMLVRTVLSAPMLFGLAYVLGMHATSAQLRHVLPYLILNGVVLFGLVKLFWIEAIHRISVTKATSLASLGPLLTILLAWIVLHQSPTLWQLASFVPFFIGVLLLTRKQEVVQQ